ncbi:hypothetical protein SPRG_02158 [Saprolegnia parasitica CBS 223.65]|uniref:COMM domain-containing protein 5 n=1 Tax=Saprolegnia parasitica (strain CBS 223.65) TaxID=695850 RepID=A0A067D3P1_SAPPC|nr:hypothetical protein SPRG_02158 [Saprolegnia parasitica CBS 223.65]KDO33351.1 hypothetical protein SPRG_02158 [Saprolegnia parasitica CBS 223.65]|eukprot:XP_012196099.1 hypothetical protein SPRG_02158 [Saprolegnia parasitica CBS 223.65]
MRALLAEIADDPVGATDAIAKAHLPPPLVAAILRHTTELQAKTPGAAIPHLHRLDWRVDITVATSSIAPVWQPTVVLRFRMTDGKIRVTELPLQQFHELRYNTAKILQEMNQLERHPIMRLTQNGQTSM